MSNTTTPFLDLKKLLYNHDSPFLNDVFSSIDKSLDYYQKFPTDLVNIGDNLYRLYIEIPGVDKKDIILTIDANKVCVAIEKKCPYSHTVELNQRSFGKFTKTINLSFNPDPKQIKAVYADGILVIDLTVSNQTQTIPIN